MTLILQKTLKHFSPQTIIFDKDEKKENGSQSHNDTGNGQTPLRRCFLVLIVGHVTGVIGGLFGVGGCDRGVGVGIVSGLGDDAGGRGAGGGGRDGGNDGFV